MKKGRTPKGILFAVQGGFFGAFLRARIRAKRSARTIGPLGRSITPFHGGLPLVNLGNFG
jgi:hypothetical protein